MELLIIPEAERKESWAESPLQGEKERRERGERDPLSTLFTRVGVGGGGGGSESNIVYHNFKGRESKANQVLLSSITENFSKHSHMVRKWYDIMLTCLNVNVSMKCSTRNIQNRKHRHAHPKRLSFSSPLPPFERNQWLRRGDSREGRAQRKKRKRKWEGEGGRDARNCFV